jgi:hypothetical protein
MELSDAVRIMAHIWRPPAYNGLSLAIARLYPRIFSSTERTIVWRYESDGGMQAGGSMS